MNWILMGKLPLIVMAPAGDGEGGGSIADAGDNAQDDDAGDDDDDDDDDDDGDDDDDDDDDDDGDDDAQDDDDGDDDDDDDDGDAGKGAAKRIRKLNERMKAAESRAKELESELAEAKKLGGDDGRAILAAAETSGILPGLMTRDEARAFQDLADLPTVIDRYQDWLDDNDADDAEFDLGGEQTMTRGQVKKRVRKLRAQLEDLKDRYGERRKELTGKVREIFTTGLAALKAGWKPDAKKTEAKKKGKKKQPKEEKPTGNAKANRRRRGDEWTGEVEDEDDLENFIAAENRKNRRKG